MWRRSSVVLLSVSLSLLHSGWGLPQSFRVAPQSVSVVAGRDVTMRCEIDNQQGKAQWTKDGFALGFNRSIPGFPRYTVLGDEGEGVHNLRITEVEIGDNGEYQCQVTPNGHTRPIRHPANLTVLLPPSSVELVGREQDARVTVRAGASVSLECLVKDAKPVAEVRWYRGNTLLRLDTVVEMVEESTTADHLASIRSTLTLTPTHGDDGEDYSCRAAHPALEVTGDRMEARVRLDVQYPPGPPEITGYVEGEIVRAGDRKTLTCRARGGNPLPEVFWYKNGEQVDKNYIKHRNYVVNEYEFELEASDNLAKYECHVMNVMTSEPKTAEIQLRVNFAPSSVLITAPDQAKVGDLITVSCLAQNSNPPSDVSLIVNGQSPPGAASRTQKVENGGWNTITNLSSYEVRPIDSDLQVNCYALNQALGSTKIDTKVVSVLRPPEPPVILGYTRGHTLRKGDPQRLSCVSRGGNPLATLKWYKGSMELSSETRHDVDTAVAELDLLLDESDNEAEYRCEATNEATQQPLVNSTILSVTFPPSAVKVRSEPRQIRAGTSITLWCESASSHPVANLTWWRDGFQVQGEEVTEVNPGQFGGTVTNYNVRVAVAAEDDGAVYTCQADNGFGSTTHDAVTISVRYPPVWSQKPNDKVEVKEGEQVLLNVSAHGNPDDVTYLWRRGDDVVMASHVLNISAVAKDHAGLYTVEASNSEGSTLSNVTIDVKYAPIVTSVSEEQKVNEGDTVTIVCHVDASPAPTMEWRRKEYDFSRSELKKHASQNIVEMTIRNVTMDDTGIYSCHAQNDIGEAVVGNTTIKIRHKPVIDESPKYQKAAAEAGGEARLVCLAKGEPVPTFTWFTSENTPIEKAIYSRFERRYTVEEPRLVDNLVTYESVLVIKNVTSRDYGFFQCQVRNLLGSTHTAIHLDGTTKPDTPLDLKVVNFTHNAVDLEWTPGFDGGLIQRYRVRYNIDGTKRYQYADVYPENVTSFTVTGLSLGTPYAFNILAYNDLGDSTFTQTEVKVTTSSTAPPTDTPPAGTKVGSGRVSGLVVVTITLAGAALLLLNVVLVACFIKRRTRKRLRASSDKASSKSTTIEMYAPSSYTGTVTGETLSSISEKSRESYDHEQDSADEYEAEAARVTAASTYLIEQLEPPAQYATRPPPHILPPPPSHNDLNIDDCYDEMMRNQYNLDHGGYGTLGRRNATPDHYNITGSEGHYPMTPPPRYNTYTPPSQPIMPTHAHNHNGSLRRNPPSKLHFPKDYIRNGSMNLGSSGQYTSKPQSPTRTTHAPMLSTFAPDAQQPGVAVPLEHRGHLV